MAEALAPDQGGDACEALVGEALTRPLLVLMAVACGVTVANIYYNQPLLAEMSRTFHVSARQIGAIPLVTQLGTAVGMLLFVPMGDITERRQLIVRILGAVTLALVGIALSRNLVCLVCSSLLVGFLSVTPHLILPFAAQLSRPEQRGHAIGTVLSGLLIGILLARTVSGYVGAVLGWREMYGLAAALTAMLAVGLRLQLPRSVAAADLTFTAMLRSLATLVRQEPILREASAIGAMGFGAFSAFWTTLVFLLEQPPYSFHLASRAAGLFGLAGVVGAAAAPIMGRIADRRGPRFTLGIALLTALGAYLVFGALGTRLWGLVVGVILLDFGVQVAHVSNQTRIYSLRPEARSRLNTVYMVSFFIGGSLGSSLGAYAWSVAGWFGVCAAGGLMAAAALLLFLRAARPTVAVS